MFGSIWAKLSSVFGALLILATYFVKILLGKNRRLKHEIKIKDKQQEIEDDQNKAVKKNAEEAKQAINEKKSDLDRDRDSLNHF